MLSASKASYSTVATARARWKKQQSTLLDHMKTTYEKHPQGIFSNIQSGMSWEMSCFFDPSRAEVSPIAFFRVYVLVCLLLLYYTYGHVYLSLHDSKSSYPQHPSPVKERRVCRSLSSSVLRKSCRFVVHFAVFDCLLPNDSSLSWLSYSHSFHLFRL